MTASARTGWGLEQHALPVRGCAGAPAAGLGRASGRGWASVVGRAWRLLAASDRCGANGARVLFVLVFVLLLVLPGVPGLVATASAQGSSRDPVLLAWSWKAGTVIRYRESQEMTQVVTGSLVPEGLDEPAQTPGSGRPADRNKPGADDQRTDWTIAYVVKQEVLSVVPDTGVARVARTYESGTIVAVERGGETVRFDSTVEADRSKAGHRLIAPYAAFIGRTITFEADPEGRVLSLDGAAEILKASTDATAASNPLLAPVIAAFSGQVSDESLRAGLERQLRVVPGRRVKPRDRWTVESDQSMPLVGVVRSTVEHTFESVRRSGDLRAASLTAKGRLAQPAASGGGGAGGGGGGVLGGMITVRLVESEIEGDTVFDVAGGTLLSSRYSTGMEWAISLAGSEGAAMTQRIDQRATLELLHGR